MISRIDPRAGVLSSLALALVLSPAASAAEPVEPPAYSVERNLVYASPAGTDLHLDAYIPDGDGPFPAVLVVHGGAWRVGSKGQLAFYAGKLAERGYAAFAINYRLAPKHPFPAQIEDCRSAVRWIRRNAESYNIDPQRVGGIGYSAGGHLVALLGVTGAASTDDPADDTRLQAVCAGGAPCDFRTLPLDWEFLAFWLGGTRRVVPELYEAASPAAQVRPDAPPMFFFHGDEDLLVPDESPLRMVEQLKAAGVEASAFIINKGGHLSAMWSPDALARACDFLDRHLKQLDAMPEAAMAE